MNSALAHRANAKAPDRGAARGFTNKIGNAHAATLRRAGLQRR
jgi:hypothetical protein